MRLGTYKGKTKVKVEDLPDGRYRVGVIGTSVWYTLTTLKDVKFEDEKHSRTPGILWE